VASGVKIFSVCYDLALPNNLFPCSLISVFTKSLAMKNVTCFQTQAVELVDCQAPAISPGELLVQLNACGICGTDIAKVYDDYFRKPVQLGHELVATVVESRARWVSGSGWRATMRPIILPTTPAAAHRGPRIQDQQHRTGRLCR
jgi:hypothetical protein